MKIQAGFLVLLAVTSAFAFPGRNPKEDTEYLNKDTDFKDFTGVVDTEAGGGFPFFSYRPYNPFNSGFFDDFQDVFRRLRESLINRWTSLISEDFDPSKGNTTSVVKIIDGHKVEVNDTVYTKTDEEGNTWFKVRVINVRPVDSDESREITTDGNVITESDKGSPEVLEKQPKDNEISIIHSPDSKENTNARLHYAPIYENNSEYENVKIISLEDQQNDDKKDQQKDVLSKSESTAVGEIDVRKDGSSEIFETTEGEIEDEQSTTTEKESKTQKKRLVEPKDESIDQEENSTSDSIEVGHRFEDEEKDITPTTMKHEEDKIQNEKLSSMEMDEQSDESSSLKRSSSIKKDLKPSALVKDKHELFESSEEETNKHHHYDQYQYDRQEDQQFGDDEFNFEGLESFGNEPPYQHHSPNEIDKYERIPVDLSNDIAINEILADQGAPHNPDAEIFAIEEFDPVYSNRRPESQLLSSMHKVDNQPIK